MTQLTRSEMQDFINRYLPNNNRNYITAGIMRAVLSNMEDSVILWFDEKIKWANLDPSIIGQTDDTLVEGNDSRFTYLQAGVGAVPRTLQNRLRDVVDAADYGVKADGVILQTCYSTAGFPSIEVVGNIFTQDDIGKLVIVNGAGVAGGPLIASILSITSPQIVVLSLAASTTTSNTQIVYGTDDSANAQKAVDAVISFGGGTVRFSRGICLITTTIEINLEANLTTRNINTIVGVNIQGAGSGMTKFRHCALNNDPIFNVRRSYTDFGPVSNSNWGGFSVQAGIPGFGNAFTFSRCTQMFFNDIYTTELDLHWQMVDCLTSTWIRCFANYGRRGFWAYRNDSTGANALTFMGCEFAGMNEWGMVLESASAFTYIGGAIELNGWFTTTPVSRGGILINNPGLEGGTAATLVGTYFETQGGQADITLLNGLYGACNLNVLGCQFDRGFDAGARWSTNSIHVEAAALNPVTVNIDGSSWKTFGGYTGSAARPNLSFTGPVRMTGSGLFTMAIEAPAAPNGDPFAVALFDGTGANGAKATIRSNNATINKIATGQYTITTGINSNAKGFVYDIIASNTIGPSILSVQWSSETANSLNFSTYNSAGVATDGNRISIKLYD